MLGHAVSRKDIQNMVHYAATVNNYEDETIISHGSSTNLIKSGKVKFPMKLLEAGRK